MPKRAARADRLRAFIETEAVRLRRTLRLYVLRAGLAQGAALDAAADDLLHDVVVEALTHAERFRPEGRPEAWLLGIAANLVRRRQADLARRERREPLAADLAGPAPDGFPDEGELFDRLAALAQEITIAGPEDALASNQAAAALLAQVSGDDRRVLELAILYELDGERLGAALGITPGAARVRLHRALHRLRARLSAEMIPAEEEGERR
jgi:RNA polymerase sigma factor (sigma-70 family)